MTTTTERLARLETAQELLGFLIAGLSSEIHQLRKASAEPAAVAALVAKKNELADLEDSLSLDDAETVERVIETFGPEVRSQRQAKQIVAGNNLSPVALPTSA